MINIEKISEKIFSIDTFSDTNNAQRLKAQYGFSVVLGIIIEFFMASIISYFIGTFEYLWPMMITALMFKGAIKSQHCTNFDRCAIFTCIYFLVPSLIVNYIHSFYPHIIGMILILVCILNLIILWRQGTIKGFNFVVTLYFFMILIYFIKENFLIYILSISIGCFLKIFSCTQMGKSFIVFCDNLLIKLGVQ